MLAVLSSGTAGDLGDCEAQRNGRLHSDNGVLPFGGNKDLKWSREAAAAVFIWAQEGKHLSVSNEHMCYKLASYGFV